MTRVSEYPVGSDRCTGSTGPLGTPLSVANVSCSDTTNPVLVTTSAVHGACDGYVVR